MLAQISGRILRSMTFVVSHHFNLAGWSILAHGAQRRGMFWCHLWQLLVCPEVAIFGNLMNVVTKLPKMATPGQATFGMSRCYHFWQLGGRIPPSCQKWQLLHMPKVANFCYVNAVAIFGNLMGVFQQVARNGNILTY